MKKTILTIALSSAFLFSSALIFSSCGSAANNEESYEHMDGEEHGDMNNHVDTNHEGMEMTETIYACPMHPEITGVKGDKCSICKMELEPTDESMHKD
jgi:hypothetical protein